MLNEFALARAQRALEASQQIFARLLHRERATDERLSGLHLMDQYLHSNKG